ncbi:MAG TPA: hypothetical protein VFN31_03540 [Candidatus Saccharimonadales bacterium]|nr:hypothetical protein [Candidatus Saccharimonadales bacterium]
MIKYKNFIFKDYTFDETSGHLDLNYGYDDQLDFHETYIFDFPFKDYDRSALDKAIQLLFFIAGTSYYKMYLAPNIVIQKGQIDSRLSTFLNKTYQKGLGEFFYVNGLDPRTKINFPVNSELLESVVSSTSSGQLIGLGGGKDSLLSVELLREQAKVATWSLNHRSQLSPLVDRVGLKHLWVERQWDPQIAQLNNQDAMNGHVPISAIFSTVGAVIAMLSGYQDIVVSNESSASEPTLSYQGMDINHQYSKSLEYEKDFQAILLHSFGDSIRYYSLLRPFSELRIAEFFSIYFDKYADVFSSCNRAFTIAESHMFWCGQCAKCAFVFLILTPFIDREKLERLWHSRNLFRDPKMEGMYRRLLGIEGNKPLDCVGEVKEARTAMRLASRIYPELSKYEFEIPGDYDYKSWAEASLPDSIFSLVEEKLA